ncbi:MAG TPA: trypsin-like peptidase domain-containing protein [Haliscomenobacter sp.]|uniref:S1C family serine protease n=1 Tax=Haliscomenobacter sp. TaxID=2717303 RepID=UPI001E049898|nr:trypsin-like peptidase domain-containing protein [Haliscomenobacter sp.]MBK9488137.1 trypsin-like peptidase domain-containing protein [Haliscomenobacter sp.]HOY17911.1 trypsin-like peptidase domain-containing protein [Haliscomenobacter sp.]HPH19928.1 trypsin-like peptidase domain-containing protein [Haliscomenobacter sp.]
MKQWIALVFSGILGGVITLTGSHFLNQGNAETLKVEPVTYARSANLPSWSSNVPFDFVQAAQKATPSVVNITAKIARTTRSSQDDFFFFPFGGRGGGGPAEGSGSGVIYSENGYIITNNHVVEGANELEVTLSDNRKYKATLIGADKKTDLAVIKIDATGLSPAEMGNSDAVRIGEWALAVGNPFDLTSTVTAGIISAKGRNIDLLGKGAAIEAFIQTDAAVNPGNSGGALVDAEGRLIGINTAIATRTGSFQGYSFAIPVNLARRVVDDIINFGDYKRPYLGVTILELDSDLAKELSVDASQGVVIDELVEGGSAQYAGLQVKDVIVGIDGREVKSVPELQEVIGRAKVGDTVNLKVLRKSKSIIVPVKLREQKNQ